jgi:hypothetical protein
MPDIMDDMVEQKHYPKLAIYMAVVLIAPIAIANDLIQRLKGGDDE